MTHPATTPAAPGTLADPYDLIRPLLEDAIERDQADGVPIVSPTSSYHSARSYLIGALLARMGEDDIRAAVQNSRECLAAYPRRA